MSQTKKDLVIGLIIGIIVAIFAYQAYGIQKLRPALVQNRVDLEVLSYSIQDIVNFLNQTSQEVVS